MPSTHLHPTPRLNRLIHYLLAATMALIVLAAPLQVLLTVMIEGAWLFLITAFFTLLLLLPLILQVTATPPVTVDEAGLTLHPVLWREQFIPWSAVVALKPYPLLPDGDGEGFRRLVIGRKTYRAAEGVMLVVPTLPLPYRVTGFFVGEGVKPVVAFTNRSHTEYDHLAQHLKRQLKKIGVE